jgi:superfamily II DNA/RNA helicase
LLIATDAANAGVNLQSARYNFNYDLPDSPSKYNQRNGRIQRIGSIHKTVVFINLVTSGGIDEAKYTKIMKKQGNINAAIDLNEEEKLSISQAAEEMDDDFNDNADIKEEQDIIKNLSKIKK